MDFLKFLLFWSYKFNVVDEGGKEVDRGDEVTDEKDDKKDEKDDKKDEKDDKKDEKDDKKDEKDDKKDEKDEKDEKDDKKDEKDEKADTALIPKSRLDFKNNLLKQAQKEIDRLNAELKAGGKDTSAKKPEESNEKDPLVEIDAAIDKAIEADDTKELARLMRERQNTLVKQLQTGYENQTPEVIARAREEIELGTFVSKLESDFPQLNPDNEDKYDKEVVDEVNFLYDSFIASGKANSAVDAMEMAVSYVMGSTKKIDDAADAAKDAGDKRSEAARRKAVDAAGKQPPDDTDGKTSSGDGLGLGDDPNPEKLTDEDLSKIPEDTKKRLRGDFV